MLPMPILGGGGALEPLFHDLREHKIATSWLRPTHGPEGKCGFIVSIPGEY
jgi:hypothetical protein